MYRMLAVLMILSLAGMAFAADVSNTQKLTYKASNHVNMNPGTPDGREGGEDVATAVTIPGLPFNDTGNTCDNINDYDAVCPYTGSTAPDVVYYFSPATDMLLQADLCLSSYDTKIYVMDGHFNIIACNDDAYFGDPPECYVYSSYVEALLDAGGNYYIVVDGYGTDCGDYVLDVTEGEVCDVVCDEDAVLENENLFDGYNDNFNGGCNSSPEVFQLLHWIDEDTECMNLSGVSGWYPIGGSDYRDTDWYEFVALNGEVTVTILTDNELTPTRCMMTTANPDCSGYDYSFQTSAIAACQEMTWTVATTPGATYWVFVAPADWVSTTLEFNYCLEICGIQYDVVPTEEASWGEVKSLYR